jgi:GNAT superfamily N-acetyltransferase
MEIRAAKIEEMTEIVTLAKAFYNENMLLKIPFDEASVRSNLLRMIQAPDAVFLVMKTEFRLLGGIGASVAKPFFNKGFRMLAERFMYITPEARGHGLRLVNAIEKEAIRLNCDAVSMALLDNSSNPILEKYYFRRAYIKSESHYLKLL